MDAGAYVGHAARYRKRYRSSPSEAAEPQPGDALLASLPPPARALYWQPACRSWPDRPAELAP